MKRLAIIGLAAALGLLLLCLVGGPTSASTSTLTGSINDAQGNPLNGSITMQLPVPAQDTATNTAIANTIVRYKVVNGTIQSGPPLYDVANLQPSNLYYITKVYDSANNLVMSANYVVTGASFNLGAATPTSITTSNIGYLSPAGTNVSNTFSNSQFFTGLLSAANLSGLIIVDGTVYAKTDVGIQAALAAAGAGTVFLPPGNYTLSNAIAMTTSGQQLVCAGIKSTTLSYTNSVNITAVLDIGTAADGTNNLFGISVNGCTISGNSHVVNAIRTRGVHRSNFSGNSLINVTGSALSVNFGIADNFDEEHTSSNEQAFTQQPTSCITLDGPDASHKTTTSTVKLPICEGVSGTGIVLGQASNNTIIAGTSEGNGTGISIASTASFTTVEGTDFESNSTADISNSSTSEVFLQNVKAGSTTPLTGAGIPWVIGGSGIAPSVSIGQVTLSSGVQTHTFATAYTGSAPSCTYQWTGSGALAGVLKDNGTTTTTLKVASTNAADTAVVNWTCYSQAQGN